MQVAAPAGSGATRHTRLVVVKTLHTMIWLTIESCMAYVLVSGIRRRSDRRAAAAAGVVAAECVVFIGNGLRCPLTDLAASLGAEHGSVTDLYLPRSIAHSLQAIHIPIVAIAAALHARNLRARTRRRVAAPRALP